MPDHASSRQSGAHKASWLDRAVDILKPQPGPPPKPHAPPVHEGEWHKSVERKQIVPGLTVHDVGLSVFGETRSLHDRPGSNEPLGAARQKVAHVIINGAEEAHRRGHNATQGATHFSIEGTTSRANKIYKRGTREGVPISTQSGPYYNSYLGRDVKSHIAWLNTYNSEYEKKK